MSRVKAGDDGAAIAAALEAREWTVAKSMPDEPHEYTLRWQWPTDRLWQRVVRFIQTRGHVETYRGYRYRVLVLGGFKYWAMRGRHKPPEPFTSRDLVIINRKSATAEDQAAAEAARGLFE